MAEAMIKPNFFMFLYSGEENYSVRYIDAGVDISNKITPWGFAHRIPANLYKKFIFTDS
jgi:hypothetical protein